MLTRFFTAACILALLVSPCAAQSNKALSLVPEDALAFFMIKDLRSLSDKIDDTARQLNVPERVSMLQLIKKELGIQEGVNENGSMLFVVLKGEQDKLFGLRPIFALPVSDHEKIAKQLAVKDIQDGIGQGELGKPSGLIGAVGGGGPEGAPQKFPILVAKRGDFVLLAPPESRTALAAVLNAKKDITATLKGTEDWLARQDMAGFVTHAGVQFGLGLFVGGSGQTSPEQAAQLQGTFAEVEKNVRLITFGGRLEKESWRLSTAAHFEANGSYANWIARAEPLESKLLANFPDEPQVALLHGNISAQTNLEGAGRYLFGVFAGLPKEQVDPLQEEMSKLLSQAREVAVCAYLSRSVEVPPNKLPVSRAEPVLLAQVRDADVFLDQAVDLIKHAHRAMHSAAKTKLEFSYDEKRIAGKRCRLITLVPDKASAVPPDQANAGQENRLAPQVFLLTKIGDQRVLAAKLANADQAEALIQKFSKPAARSLESNSNLQHTRKLLPEKLQVAVFVDLQMFGILGRSAKPVSDAPPLGFSMHTLPAGVEAQFAVSFDTMKAMFDARKQPPPKE